MAQTRFAALLKNKIEGVVQERATQVANGACTDYPQYKENVGYIRGLLDAIKLADDVEIEEYGPINTTETEST